MKSSKRPAISPTSINDLPESILVHIISFLPLDVAVRTSAVARSWRNLWLSVPNLNFTMKPFHSKTPAKSTKETCLLFSRFITKTLLNRQNFYGYISLHRFKLFLRCPNNEYTQNYFDSWLQSVIAGKVKCLDLKFSRFSFHPNKLFNDNDAQMFNLGSTLFSHLAQSSVEVLRLDGVHFRFPDEAFSLRLESIREVHLEGFRSTEKDITGLIASCVNLESLYLGNVKEGSVWKKLKIVSQKLKNLTIGSLIGQNHIGSIEICAPSLISLGLISVCAEKFMLMTSSSSLVEAHVHFCDCTSYKYFTNSVSCLSGVERLSIQNMWPKWLAASRNCLSGDNHGVFSEAFVYRNLKHVRMQTGFYKDDILGLGSFLKQCPQLLVLVLERMYKIKLHYFPEDMPADFNFHIPCLRLVEMKDYAASEVEMYVVALLKKHGVVLEKIVAYSKEVNGKLSPPIVL